MIGNELNSLLYYFLDTGFKFYIQHCCVTHFNFQYKVEWFGLTVLKGVSIDDKCVEEYNKLKRIVTVQVCDATNDDSSNSAGNKRKI